ncbi:EamA family transporter [bacterium]|nr:EamA family transporter [bacterium]
MSRLWFWPHLICLYWIWGSSYLANQSALDGYPPCILAALRCLAAALVFGLYSGLRGRFRLTRSEAVGSLMVGGLLLGFGNAGLLLAQQSVSPGLASILFASVGGWVALFSWLLGQPLSRSEWYAIGLGSLITLTVSASSCGGASFGGVCALLLSSIAWGLGTVLAHRLRLPHGPDALCVQYLGGVAWLILLAHKRLEHLTTTPPVSATLALVYLVVGCSVIGYAVHQYLVRNASPAWASSYVYVTPAVAVFLQGILG